MWCPKITFQIVFESLKKIIKKNIKFLLLLKKNCMDQQNNTNFDDAILKGPQVPLVQYLKLNQRGSSYLADQLRGEGNPSQ